MNKKRLITIIILVIIAVFVWLVISSGDDNGVVEDTALKEVELVSIKELKEKNTILPIVGEITSKSEVTIKAEASGGIKGVYVSAGEFVKAGRVIAEIDNSSQLATVLQAQGAVESAEALLTKTQQGSRGEQISILELRLKQAEDILKEAKQSTINTLRSEFATADDSIRNKIDQFFSNPRSTDPQLTFTTTNSQLEIDIEFSRFALGGILETWSKELSSITTDDNLFDFLDSAERNLIKMRDFMDKAAIAVNSISPNSNLSQATIDVWKSAVLLARTNINTSLSDISSGKDNLNSKISSYEIAKKQREEGVSGGREEDVLQAQAGLKQAKGALRFAQSALEKTIIRSPINGTINKLYIEKGNFVSMFESVSVVSNSRALQITSFITEDDRRGINVGAEALIDKKFKGVVSEIAPTLDKKTKKIEIKISILDTDAKFIEGESVELEISRLFVTDEAYDEIIIPISSLKIKTDEIVVFSVDMSLSKEEGENKLIAHPVSVGSIVGSGIIVISGVTLDMEIVADARGLREGQEVVVKK